MGVTVVGSFSGEGAFDPVRVAGMMRDTVDDSINKIQELVKGLTPVGLDHTHRGQTHTAGTLKNSVKTKGPRHIASRVWQGEVFSDLEYAAAIEYGMPAMTITAKNGGKLAFLHEGKLVVVSSVQRDAIAPVHMFQKGANRFEAGFAEPIARRNAALWLGAVDAGRGTVVI